MDEMEMGAPAEQLVLEAQGSPSEAEQDQLRAMVEAIVYVTEEPAPLAQIARALGQPEERVKAALGELAAEYAGARHGIMIREVAGGYQMATKPEHHDAIRAFVKSLKPPLKLSLAALETLATIAYKQPVTAPEIMEIRGVQGAGVLKTLLDRKLIQACGRKNVIGRPILYKTTKEFLVQFGLKDLSELPTLKEFEELRRLAVSEPEIALEAPAPEAPAAETPAPEAHEPPDPGPDA
jgi:segregation and condensation protein B